jgi:hypothetical protein
MPRIVSCCADSHGRYRLASSQVRHYPNRVWRGYRASFPGEVDAAGRGADPEVTIRGWLGGGSARVRRPRRVRLGGKSIRGGRRPATFFRRPPGAVAVRLTASASAALGALAVAFPPNSDGSHCLAAAPNRP